MAALFLLVASPSLHASASLPLGTISVGDPITCPSGSGWYYYTDSGQNKHYMNCYGATVNCSNVSSNVQDLGMTFGYLSPVGLVSGVTSANVKGVIVLHSGGGGTTPSQAGEGDFEFADYYFGQGYEIVELAWNSDWESIQDPFQTGVYGNVQYAACRPATFLNYVYTHIFNTVQQNNSAAGMCAQGGSAGSAALAYYLAYYGGGSTLDAVEFTSGPTLADMKQGCEVPNAASVTVCGLNGGNQYGCQLGSGGSPWTLSPTYLNGANGAVSTWTNDPTCANTYPTTTSSASNLRWLQQSLVDDGTNNPTFTYSSTALSGWLCRTVNNPNNYNCAAVGNNNVNYCPNNSSPQGQVFYANIGSTNSPPAYNVWAMNLCAGSEGVGNGHVGTDTGQKGFDAIKQDMAGIGNTPGQCVHRTH